MASSHLKTQQTL